MKGVIAVTFSEAKRCFREITARYFKDANIMFANQSHAVKPTSKPLVTIAFGNIKRPLNPPTLILDGRPASYYPTSVPVTVNLFTHGRKIEIAKGITPAMEDTAAEDLTDFLSFLNSETAIQFCCEKDIAIVVPNDVTPLSGIINDVAYEYRARAEIELRFTSMAAGYSGTLPVESVSIKYAGTISEPSSGDSYETNAGDNSGTNNGNVPQQGSGSNGFKVFGNTELFDKGKYSSVVIPKAKTSPSGGNNEDFLDEEDYYFTNVALGGKKVKPDD